MVDEKLAIAICGQIGSGKSSVSQELARLQAWDVVTFGQYVRDMASKQGVGHDRESLQSFGQAMIQSLGADSFLNATIAHFAPMSVVHIFDGVRHPSIVAALRRRYTAVVVVCLSAQDRRRYERYSVRTESPADFETFLAWSDHLVERGTIELCVDADVELDMRLSAEVLARQILDYLWKTDCNPMTD